MSKLWRSRSKRNPGARRTRPGTWSSAQASSLVVALDVDLGDLAKLYLLRHAALSDDVPHLAP